MAESLPSFSSQLRKAFPIFPWKCTDRRMIYGTGSIAMIVSFQFMPSMNERLSASSTTMRKMLVICSDTKLLSVSMSLVQRWMISPVRCWLCHA